MKRYIEGEDRSQTVLLPTCLDDYVAEANPVRAVDAFAEELDLKALGFAGVDPAVTGRPAYHPAALLKVHIYGYLNRVPSSRRLEREDQRNAELMCLTGRLAPDFKKLGRTPQGEGGAQAIPAGCCPPHLPCRTALISRTEEPRKSHAMGVKATLATGM
jgi:hypothetical protein